MEILQMFVFAVICSKCLSDSEHALCSKTKSTQFFGKTTYFRNYFCCRGFEEKNGQCIECQNGFTTSNGEPCKPCEQNKFGMKCAHTCYCTEIERCDSKLGCVPLHTEASTERFSTGIDDNQQTTVDIHVQVSEQDKNVLYSSEESKHTTNCDFENNTGRTDGNGVRTNQYITYIIWAGCCLFIILIVVSSSICIGLNKKMLLEHFAYLNSIPQENIGTAEKFHFDESGLGAYTEINEQNMCEDHEIERKVVTRKKSHEGCNGDVYLNPCRSLLSESASDPCKPCTIDFECEKSSISSINAINAFTNL